MILHGLNEKSLEIELNKYFDQVETQKQLIVKYDGYVVGKYYADIVVDDKIIIELKTVIELNTIHKMQILNYSWGVELLKNFGYCSKQLMKN